MQQPTAPAHLSPDFLGYISAALIFFMFAALVGVLYIVRTIEKTETDGNGNTTHKRGRFTRRSIQFLSAAMFLPAVLLLALNALVSTDILGTLLGTFIGYVLSGIGEGQRDK
jgi:glycerol uptake facilitator-like aquaporin